MKSSAQAMNRSINGGELLRLVRDPSLALSHLDHILSLITDDPLAGLLKSKETGNTAFHYLLQKEYHDDFVIPVLKALIRETPSGVRVINAMTMKLPIHIAAARPSACAGTSETSSLQIMTMLIDAHSNGLATSSTLAATMPSSSLPAAPLLVYLQRREVPNSQIVAKMCSSHEDAASQRDDLANRRPGCSGCISRLCRTDQTCGEQSTQGGRGRLVSGHRLSSEPSSAQQG